MTNAYMTFANMKFAYTTNKHMTFAEITNVYETITYIRQGAQLFRT